MSFMLTTPPSLLQRLRESPEQAAWERFVEMYTPLFFSWTSRLRLEHHEAASLVQEVFAVLVEQLPIFVYDRQKSFRAYLKTILLNRWRNHLRRRSSEAVAGRPDIDAIAADSEVVPEFE